LLLTLISMQFGLMIGPLLVESAFPSKLLGFKYLRNPPLLNRRILPSSLDLLPILI